MITYWLHTIVAAGTKGSHAAFLGLCGQQKDSGAEQLRVSQSE